METTELYPPFTVGVDLGGTNTAFAIVDSVGHIVANDSIPTRTPTCGEMGRQSRLEDILRMIADNILEGMIEESESARRAPTPRQDASRAPPICPGPLPIALVNMMESRTGLRNRHQQRRQRCRHRRNDIRRRRRRTQEFHSPTPRHKRRRRHICDGHLPSGKKRIRRRTRTCHIPLSPPTDSAAAAVTDASTQ